MAFKTPPTLYTAMAGSGEGRTKQTLLATMGLTFLAGAYIALGGLLAIRVSATLPSSIWGSFAKLVFAGVFPLGLLLVLVCGADLFTGNSLTLAAASFEKKISFLDVLKSGAYSWIGNFIGAMFVAYFMAVASGLIFAQLGESMPWANMAVKIANGKTALSFGEAFWRAVGCNWLVCLAVYAASAAEDITGKVVAMWFPVMAFVAIGMEHCVANMFFVPLGIWAGSDPRYLDLVASGQATGLTANWADFFANNLLPVTLGNIVGGAILVAGIYALVYRKK